MLALGLGSIHGSFRRRISISQTYDFTDYIIGSWIGSFGQRSRLAGGRSFRFGQEKQHF
jgi:hypothetical protein